MRPSHPAHSAEFQMPGNREDGGVGGVGAAGHTLAFRAARVIVRSARLLPFALLGWTVGTAY